MERAGDIAAMLACPQVSPSASCKRGMVFMSVIPALWRKRREDQDFEVLPGYTASSKSAWVVWHYLCIYLHVCLSSYLSTYVFISPETVSSHEDAVVLLWQGWRSWWTERIKSSIAMKLDFPGRCPVGSASWKYKGGTKAKTREKQINFSCVWQNWSQGTQSKEPMRSQK